MLEIFASYSSKFFCSFVITLLFLAVYAIACLLLSQKIEDPKRYNQTRIRMRYLLITLFLVCFVKIWVNGFIQIVAFIGFISAAITITQKDNLMNIIGWLIINWRELFHEGDYIKIANNIGIVKTIGVMYFTLQETNIDFPHHNTGRVIKIPNGLVARNPVLNYSYEVFTESTLSYVFKPTGNFDLIEKLFLTIKQQMLHYLEQAFKMGIDFKQTVEELSPKHVIRIRQEKPAGFELVMMFYSKYQDKPALLNQINKTIIAFSQANPDLVIAFD